MKEEKLKYNVKGRTKKTSQKMKSNKQNNENHMGEKEIKNIIIINNYNSNNIEIKIKSK